MKYAERQMDGVLEALNQTFVSSLPELAGSSVITRDPSPLQIGHYQTYFKVGQTTARLDVCFYEKEDEVSVEIGQIDNRWFGEWLDKICVPPQTFRGPVQRFTLRALKPGPGALIQDFFQYVTLVKKQVLLIDALNAGASFFEQINRSYDGHRIELEILLRFDRQLDDSIAFKAILDPEDTKNFLSVAFVKAYMSVLRSDVNWSTAGHEQKIRDVDALKTFINRNRSRHHFASRLLELERRFDQLHYT